MAKSKQRPVKGAKPDRDAHRLFWFVVMNLPDGSGSVDLDVAAMTLTGARREARKRMPGYVIDRVVAVNYSHAWVVDQSR